MITTPLNPPAPDSLIGELSGRSSWYGSSPTSRWLRHISRNVLKMQKSIRRPYLGADEGLQLLIVLINRQTSGLLARSFETGCRLKVYSPK